MSLQRADPVHRAAALPRASCLFLGPFLSVLRKFLWSLEVVPEGESETALLFVQDHLFGKALLPSSKTSVPRQEPPCPNSYCTQDQP